MIFGRFRKKPTARPAASPAEVYAQLRGRVLALSADEIGVSPREAMPVVWGVLMEFNAGAHITFVALADNTTSLYFSNGGGLIGAGEHKPVAAATQSLIAMAQQYHDQFQPTTEYPPPAEGEVRFYLLTFSGVTTATAPDADLNQMRHPLSPLFHKAHEAIANVRIASKKQ